MDWSDEAAEAMYVYESHGKGQPPSHNGYRTGKVWLDWQIEQWRDDMESGLLLPDELTADPKLELYQSEVAAAIQGASL